ncbi:MAG: hypothetical protein HFH60_07430 [Lachnospiraceae bacterium]|nr:hypothetical protein [Lachnospiraceae bacterium]
MKTKAIQSLYTGRPIPCEAAPPESQEYRALMNECHQRVDQLINKISSEIKDELEYIHACRQDALQYEIQQAFAQGYSLGVRLTAESFLNELI